MGILETVFKDKKEPEEEQPERVQFKTYRLCTEDRPDEKEYRCGKRNQLRPNCHISVSLDGLMHEEMAGIEEELREILKKHDFQMR